MHNMKQIHLDRLPRPRADGDLAALAVAVLVEVALGVLDVEGRGLVVLLDGEALVVGGDVAAVAL